MLSIKELVIKNDQQGLILIDRLSFTVNQNDKIAIIGSEGSGKSTLLNIISGKTLPHISYSGSIIKPPVIAYLEQNIITNWANQTTEQYFAGNNDYDYYQKLPKLASDFGLDYHQIHNRLVGSFSGGEVVKLGLIKAFLNEPDLLLLDEPSNDLDFNTLLFLESFLINLTIPVLFVSHDQRLLENVSTGIIHLGQIHKKSKPKTTFLNTGYKEFKQFYAAKYETDLMIAKKERSDYKQKMIKFNQIYQKVEYQQNQAVRNPSLASLLKKKIKNLKSQEKRYQRQKEEFTQIPEREEPLELFFDKHTKINTNKQLLNLDINNFKLKNNQVIKKIKLQLTATDKIIITGANGCGKTTLLKYITTIFDQDQIEYGYLSQNYLEILDPTLSPVAFLLKESNYPEPKIRTILGTLELKKDEMTSTISTLSEGTKLKVLLLLLVAKNPLVLILDEPTRNLSPLNQDQLYELFSNFDGAIIAVSHDRAFIETVFDDIYQLNNDGLTKL